MGKRGPRPKKNVGRPTVMTPEVIGKLEQAFGVGASDREACFHAGIHLDSLYEYIKKHPEFSERKEDLKERLVLVARRTLAGGINVDADLALKFLERKRKDEFSLRSEQVITGPKKFIMEFVDDEQK